MNKRSTNTRNGEGISRREMVQKLVGGASTGIIGSTLAASPASPAPELTKPNEVAKSIERNPLVLDAHQAQTLVVLAEIMIPGSTRAEVAPFIDLLLSVDTVEHREQFIGSISAMDGEALRQFGVPFKTASAAQQIELLTAAAKPVAAPGSSESTASIASTLPANVLHGHFQNLKAWISKAYYSSETGMRELGWSDNYFYPELPECGGVTT